MSKTDELRATFFQEAEDLLEGLADGLEELSSGTGDPETVNSVFRAVHSIKGGAAAFALEPVVEFAHSYENVLDALRNGDLSITQNTLDVLTRAADHLSSLVELVRDDIATAPESGVDLLGELAGLTGKKGDAESEPAIEFTPMSLSLDDLDASAICDMIYLIEFRPMPGLYSSGNEAGYLLRDLCALGDALVQCDVAAVPDLQNIEPHGAYLKWEITLKTEASESAIREIFEFVDEDCELRVSEQDPEQFVDISGQPDADLPALLELIPSNDAEDADPALTEPTRRVQTQIVASTIRVDLDRIDRMINLVGELVINQAMLAQCVKRSEMSADSDIEVGLEELSTLTRQIQDSVMAIRAQPVKALFQRMSRIAREAGVEAGKTMRVITEGAGTEIDKTMVEKLADPLTHMIRNAVDHGLENAEERKESRKDLTGTIRLSAAHMSGRVVIEIEDDGAGIDRQRVRQIAEDKGLMAPDAQLAPNDIDNLIFLPGFSTAREVSALSGRGVGMDVVKRSIQSMGGRVSITSEPGQGSTFTITLPLTLAVLDGMVIHVGTQTLVVPISAIVETMRLVPGQLFQLGPQSIVVRIRGTYVPIIDVGAALGYRDPIQDPETRVYLLVETTDGVRAALMIDGIDDQRQVVIKGLEENYGHVPGVAAATILGDGRIALILDPFAIVTDAGIGANDDWGDLPDLPLTAAE